METLRIPKKAPDKKPDSARAVKVTELAYALIVNLCSETNRSQQDIASRLIEWGYGHVEITEDEA